MIRLATSRIQRARTYVRAVPPSVAAIQQYARLRRDMLQRDGVDEALAHLIVNDLESGLRTDQVKAA